MSEETQGPRALDKSQWQRGPWDTEPDRVDWEAHGLPCLLLRNHYGVWCGYAAVAPGHPWYGLSYDDVPIDLDVHGGLTYASACDGHICHVPKPGAPSAVWWFGFDCGHGGDLTPHRDFAALGLLMTPFVYRTMAYARAEVERLAAQLAAHAEGGDA